MIEIPYIPGDGVGPEVTQSMMRVVDAAIEVCYSKCINWIRCLAGQEALIKTGSLLPQRTIYEISNHVASIKGPLTTPIGNGHRSLNVQLRQMFDLYACVRPVKYYPGVKSPLIDPHNVNITVFRENTEDIYAGIEYPVNSPKSLDLQDWIDKPLNFPSAFALKPVSIEGSKRLIRSAFEYANKTGLNHVTLVHKGNIMKHTEGLFRDCGYEVAKEYPNIKVDDCICDAFMQNAILHPENYDVVATLNLNGDYISDMLAALVGGIGISPGANINYDTGQAIFEATHGTAPSIAARGIVNPCSCILSGAMLLDYLEYPAAARLIDDCVAEAILDGDVTKDLSTNGISLSTTKFTDIIVQKIKSHAKS